MMLPSTQFHKPETWMPFLDLRTLMQTSKNQVFPVLPILKFSHFYLTY